MANLQVKNVPAQLHADLRARAAREGVSLSDLVTRMLLRELSLPSMADWFHELDELGPLPGSVDTPALLDEVRGEPPR